MDITKGRIVLFTNGMVACFDEDGQQMPEYQGHYGEVINRIMDTWPHRSIALAQWYPDGPKVLAWFTPERP